MARVGAIILAAGGSRRFGRPKQLTRLGGLTLVERVVQAAHSGGCSPAVVVTGESHESVAEAIAGLNPLIVRNENWSRGIGSSIRVGVERLGQHGIDALLLLACDQPGVDRRVVSALIKEHKRSGQPIVASRYAGTSGIPALFHRSLFEELLQLPDTCGAKLLIQKNSSRMAHIDFADGVFDLDTSEDLLTWQERQRAP